MTDVSPLPTRVFEASMGQVAFHDEGDGPPVVLVHGFPASSWQWRDFLPLLATRFRVVAPDLPGAGGSRPAGAGSFDLAARSGAVRELLMHLGVHAAAVVAHGSGGVVARSLLLDDTAPNVDALVLVGADMIGGGSAAGVSQVRAALDATPDSDGRASVARGVVREVFERGALVHDRLPRRVLDGYADPYADGDGPEWLARVAEGLAADPAANDEELDALARVDVPVLILWGEDDPLAPVGVGERLNEAMPSSTLGLLPGCGHFLIEEAADTIAPMISEYLRARYAHAPHGHADPSAGVVMLQLERRPPWVDLEEYETDDWFDTEDGTDDDGTAGDATAGDGDGDGKRGNR
ncbi:MAG: alpha/beta fold hydrolase [Actinomycetota bacterium]